MKAAVFPGQGSQFTGMGLEFKDNEKALEYLDKAKSILGFDIFEIMLDGSEDDLKETRVTQPAVYLHGIIKYFLSVDPSEISAFAGHSLGEITALVASGNLSFEDGLKLVLERALAMQYACELKPTTMAAVLGLDDQSIIETCKEFDKKIVPANFNCPGQVVISGEIEEMAKASEKLSAIGAKRVIELKVGGAFHSPYMQPASERLNNAIDKASFQIPIKPIYQNFDAKAQKDPFIIAGNLKKQLISPVMWTNSVRNMINDGITHFYEVGGKGNILAGLIRKIDRSVSVEKV